MYRGRQWHPAPVLLPGTSHGWRSLEGCSPWGCWESDMTEWLHFPFSLSCIGEGNGNTLQGSCLENPRDGGAWWAAVYGVAQSQTRLKWLSSSSQDVYIQVLILPHFYIINQRHIFLASFRLVWDQWYYLPGVDSSAKSKKPDIFISLSRLIKGREIFLQAYMQHGDSSPRLLLFTPLRVRSPSCKYLR